MAQKNVQKSITIPVEYDAWMRKNCISPSRFLQKHIEIEMAKHSHNENVETEDGPKKPSVSSSQVDEHRGTA